MTPAVLTSIADALAAETRFSVAGEWAMDNSSRWHLPIVARLSVTPSEHMPAETMWRLVVGSNQSDGVVFFYPDAQEGLAVTFRHQDQNRSAPEGSSWRPGKPCLERPIAGLGRDEWGDEPRDIEAAAIWKAGRLLQWIDAAATGTLITNGSPNELPAGLGQGSQAVIGFRETSSDLGWWKAADVRWGFARLAAVPGAKSTLALVELLDERSKPLREFEWGIAISKVAPTITAAWMLAAELPVRPPWDTPVTWAQLSEALADQGIDLAEVIVGAGARFRASTRTTSAHRLLIGFPYAMRVGEAPERIHWLAVGGLALAGRKEKRDGFRPREESRRLWDRQIAASHTPLRWLRTENWAPDQLQSRGGAAASVIDASILVIGAGSLGSAVADSLCRAGALNLAIMDGEALNTGNLVRHVLTMADIGHNKAEAMARMLNSISPNASVAAMPFQFAANTGADTAALIRSYDVVIDCTGSDDVLDEIAKFEWGEEKTFVSLSMTWRGEGLLAFCASEAHFPAIDAKDRFARSGAPPVRHEDANVEAIGCWHPVFPADAADVAQWSAMGCKFVEAAIADPTRRLLHFRRSEHGGVEVTRA